MYHPPRLSRRGGGRRTPSLLPFPCRGKMVRHFVTVFKQRFRQNPLTITVLKTRHRVLLRCAILSLKLSKQFFLQTFTKYLCIHSERHAVLGKLKAFILPAAYFRFFIKQNKAICNCYPGLCT